MKLIEKLITALKNTEADEIQDKVEILASEDNVVLVNKKAEVKKLKRAYEKLLWSEKSAKEVVDSKIAYEVSKKELETLELIINIRYEEA